MKMVIWFAAFFLSVSPCPVSAKGFSGKVVAVSDGDTITVLKDGRGVKVRLNGVDCPEKAQPFGKMAKQFTGEMVFGCKVRVDVAGKDKYDRVIGNVFTADGRMLNAELVRAGMAWWYRKYSPKDKALAQLELDAKRRKVGLWADRKPVPPWEWRRRSATR